MKYLERFSGIVEINSASYKVIYVVACLTRLYFIDI